MELTYLGNKELMTLPKTAFLASSTISPEMVLPCYDWAQRVCKEGRCVISGFSSHLEAQVLQILIKGSQPIIMVLARRMLRVIPEEFKPLLENGRLLIISISDAVRQSKLTAPVRNQFVCEQADDKLMVGVTESSSLATLKRDYKEKLLTI